MSKISGGAAAVVVGGGGILDVADVVTFSVVVPQSVAAEVEVGGVDEVGVEGTRVVVVNSGIVVEVVESVETVCKVLSVETVGVSGRMCGVVLLVVKGDTGVTDSVVFTNVTFGRGTVIVSTEGDFGKGEAVVEAVLGKPGGLGVVVDVLSTVTAFVLVPVYAVVAVLETVVLSVRAEVSETGEGLGLEVVTTGVAAVECVVASVVSLVGSSTVGVLTVVGPSTVVVLGVVVVVKGGGGVPVEAVTQNRVERAKGATVVLAVLRPNWLMVKLSGPVVVVSSTVVGGASVTLTVVGGSTTEGTVGGDKGPVVVTGRVVSSGAGGAMDGVVSTSTAGTVVVTSAVEGVYGVAEDVEVAEMVVWSGVVEAAVLVVVAEVTAAEVS